MSGMKTRAPVVAGREVEGGSVVEIHSPFDGAVVSKVRQADEKTIERALVTAYEGRTALAATASGERRTWLSAIAAGLKTREAEFVEAIVREAGKPVTAARIEVRRAAEVFTLAAAELSRFGAEAVAVDLFAGTGGTSAEVKQFPAGVVVGIVPFNFPLNLGAHKVAPAIAVGAPIIIKPPNQAPTAQLLLAELALEAGVPGAAFQVVPCANELAQMMASDKRVRVVSFTGSAKVGWMLKQQCPGKVLLELGGNAAAIVAVDADVEKAVTRLVAGAFAYAGQVCIKVQRLMVDASIAETFERRFIEEAKKLVVGDPANEETVVGPVIDAKAAERITAWVDEAIHRGAKVRYRGERKAQVLGPVILSDVPREVDAYREEIFGPVVCIERVGSAAEGIARVNDSEYGLQASVFTNDLALVRKAFEQLEVGGLIINDAPSFRSDNMPYGGNKRSGLGREGVRYTMADYCEPKVLVLRG